MAPTIVPAADREVIATSAIDKRAKLGIFHPLLTKIPAGLIDATVDGDIDTASLQEGDVFRVRLDTRSGSFGSTKTKAFGSDAYAECKVLAIQTDPKSGESTAFYRVNLLVEPAGPSDERAYPVVGVLLDQGSDPEEISHPHEEALRASEVGARFGQLAFGDANHYFMGDALTYFGSRIWTSITKKPPAGTLRGKVASGTPVRIQITEDIWF